jgi:hypothetical protein
MTESTHPASTHPAATHHLPSFITAPGETDVLMGVMAVILLLATLGFGILFLRLHALPEQMAHKSHKLQFEIVAVMCLISLFTHQHIFWIAGLLLAMIDLPDFGTPLNRIARSAESLAGLKPDAEATEPPAAAEPHADQPMHVPGARHAGDAVVAWAKPEITPVKPKERIHA